MARGTTVTEQPKKQIDSAKASRPFDVSKGALRDLTQRDADKVLTDATSSLHSPSTALPINSLLCCTSLDMQQAALPSIATTSTVLCQLQPQYTLASLQRPWVQVFTTDAFDSAAQLAQKLCSCLDRGLCEDASDLGRRAAAYGANRFPERAQVGPNV